MTWFGHAAYLWSQHPVPFTILAFVVAWVLYGLRHFFRPVYAILEIGLGLFALFKSAPQFTPGFGPDFDPQYFVQGGVSWSLVTAAGAMYFVVRGLDNLYIGFGFEWPGSRAKKKAATCNPPKP